MSKRVLLIKMSSLGDVIHTLPAASDASLNGAQIDWVVEEAFADIPASHPGVSRVLPIAWRRWRKSLRQSRGEMRDFFAALRSSEYDVVLDSQGLIKSAAVAVIARGQRHGFAHTVAREPWAAFAYTRRHVIARRQHAIERQRQLFAAVLGYDIPAEAHSGLEGLRRANAATGPVILLHGTTWPTKHWPLAMWQALAQMVRADGYEAVVTWGNDEERVRAEAIAEASGATVQPRVPLSELATLLANAAAVIGVDSGLCHFSAALGTPTLGLYGPTDAVLTGARGQRAQTLSADVACAPCVRPDCRRYKGPPRRWQDELVKPPCFADLPPQRVWQQARMLMVSD